LSKIAFHTKLNVDDALLKPTTAESILIATMEGTQRVHHFYLSILSVTAQDTNESTCSAMMINL